MATPTVTITVAGSPVAPVVSDSVLESHLHMVYAQAVKGDERRQWVVFPPQVAALGCAGDNPGIVLILSRHQTFAGNRSKWFQSKSYVGTLAEQLTTYAAQGWTTGGVVAVPLEKDDYLSAWGGDTPHKAMRAVSRQTEAAYGITVK